jgi:cellulose 1,4-beta-cellobiosidase
VSYPSIFIGSNYSHTSANSGLPRAVNSLGPITTRLSHNADASIPGIFNASYDVWFSTTSAGDTGAPSGGYLMVWLWDPPQKNPVGGAAARWPGVTINGVSGTWDVWAPASPGQGQGNVISYVRTQTTKSLTFDLHAFILDAVSRGYIQNGWYLSNVFGGFEIWSGGVGLNLSCFYVHMA